MSLNFAHLHLLLNHFPIIGSMVGFGLLLASFMGKNQDLRRASLIVFAGIALLTIPTFLSGFGAQLGIYLKYNPSAALVERHEGSAMLSLWFMLATGAFSFVGLWQFHRRSHPANWTVATILFLSLLTVGLMARTGNTGGDIRHPEVSEIRQGKVVEGPVGSIFYHFEPSPEKFSHLMLKEWWWDSMMALHFVGLAMLIGTVGLLDLRITGFFKQFPVAPLYHFIPFAMAGLGVNIVTGMLTFIAQPESYIYSGAFWLKMSALMLLGLNAAVFYLAGVSEHLENLGPGQDAPVFAKLVAGSSLVLCFALIILGSYIPPLSDTIRNVSH